MANQLKTKFIGNDQVTSEKVLLQNNTALRAKDSSDVTQDILKLDATDKVIVYRSTGAEEIAYMSDVNSGGTALQDHIDDPTGAHAASAISVSTIANLAATDVQAALAEIQGDLDNIDTTYVNVSGDTMQGDLTMGNGNINLGSFKVQLEPSSGYELRFDNTSPDAGTYLVSAGDVIVQSGAGQKISFLDGGSSDVFIQQGAMYNVDKVTANPDNATTTSGQISFAANQVTIDANAGTGTINMLSKVDMGKHDLMNASKLEVQDISSNVLFKADQSEVLVNDSSDPTKGLFYAGSGSASIAGYDAVTTSQTYSNAGTIGSLHGVESVAFNASGTAQHNTALDLATNDLYSKNQVSSGSSIAYGTAKYISSSSQASFEIGVSDAVNSGTYAFSPTTLDMDGKMIVDVQQLENLSAGTASGNTLRWDELGAYSISAGYGIATLGSDGKILAEQLPAAVMEYKGTWDASTNTPTLANGNPPNAPEDAGHLYKVSVGGTVNFGAGNITFNAGDTVILSAALIWEKSSDANLVTSVNGAQGVVVLDAEDLTYLQGNASDWTVADNSSIKLTLDEVGSRLTNNENQTAAVIDDVSHLVTLSGVTVDSDNLGSFTGTTIADNQTVKQALQALETAHEEVDQNANDLIALSGVAENDINLGSFTGTTIADNQTVKSALQDLETAHEAHLNDSIDAHDASAISLSPAINSQTDVQSAMGDHETRIDALEAVVYAAPYKKTLIAGDITNGYIDLPFLAVQTDGMRVCVDRLQMHQGASEDYSLSVVGGVTRITFLNDMVDPGPQKLAAGDNIYVVYQKNA